MHRLAKKSIMEALSETFCRDQDERQQKILQNRSILQRLTEIAILFAKQNIAFRGHRDDSGNNRGNLYTHQAKHDTLLKEHVT